MKKIDIICNDKIYAEMLALELEALGYKAGDRNSGRADIVLMEKEGKGEANLITFSKKEGSDLLRPFDIAELVTLIESKKPTAQKTDCELYVSEKSPYATYHNVRIELSELEHRMLLYLYKRSGEYVSTQELAHTLFDSSNAENPVRVYISYLRNKLDEAFGVKLIYTARGKGYQLKCKK